MIHHDDLIEGESYIIYSADFGCGISPVIDGQLWGCDPSKVKLIAKCSEIEFKNYIKGEQICYTNKI